MLKAHKHTPASYSRTTLRLIGLVTVFDNAIFLFPVYVLYARHIMGSVAGVGIVLGVSAIVSAAAEIPTGIFSDLYGRVKTVQLASLLAFVSQLTIVAAWWLGPSVLILAAVLGAVADACVTGNHDSLVHETLEGVGYEKKSARIDVYTSVGAASSALVGGIVASRSLLVVGVISLLPRFASFIVSVRLREKSSFQKKSSTMRSAVKEFVKVIRFQARHPVLRNLTLGRVVAFGFGEVSWQYRIVYVSTLWPLWAVGTTTAIGFTARTLGGLVSERFRRWSGGNFQAIISSTLIGRLIVLVGIGINNVLTPLSFGLVGVFGTANSISGRAIAHANLTDDIRATAISTSSFLITIVNAVLLVAFGYIIDHLGIRASMALLSGGTLLSLPFYFAAMKNSQKTTSV